MPKEIAEILRKAKALIDAPEKWTKGAFARDRSGGSVPIAGDEACAFCAAGAIYSVIDKFNAAEFDLEDRAASAIGQAVGGSIAGFNDDEDTTHADVMAAFDRAIATESATPTAAGAE